MLGVSAEARGGINQRLGVSSGRAGNVIPRPRAAGSQAYIRAENSGIRCHLEYRTRRNNTCVCVMRCTTNDVMIGEVKA